MKLIALFILAILIIPYNCDFICPKNFINLGGVCYFFSTTQATWLEAYSACNAKGSSLISIETKGEEFLINMHITYLYEDASYWTSGSDIESEGQYKWTATGNYFEYTNWCSGEPANGNGIEDCIHLYHVGKTTCWNDAACNANYLEAWRSPLYYICEYHVPQYLI